MSKMLVTGVNGFTGRHFLKLARITDFEVHGLVREDAPVDCALTSQHTCDLNDLDQVRQLVSEIKPNVVVHLAGAAFVGGTDVEAFYQTNTLGTRNLLDGLSRLQQAPSAVLVASSANVYGNNYGGAISENLAPNPVNDYGVSKLAMEYVTRLFRDKLPIILTRPFNYTGNGQSVQYLIPKIVDHVRRRASELTLGNINVARDFSDVRDVVKAYLQLIDNPSATGKTVNICSGRAYKIADIIAMVKEISGHDFDIVVDQKLVRANEISELWGERGLLKDLIADPQIIPIHETLQWMING